MPAGRPLPQYSRSMATWLAGAPGRIRTRDQLLRRHLPGVAGRRLASLYLVISCIDRGWAWLEVAGGLSPLAPFLAPPIWLPSLIPESAKGSPTG